VRVRQYHHLYQLTFLPTLFPVNCYIVEEEDSLVLIDAALPFAFKGILSVVHQIGKPLNHILLTHAHEDHVGALDGLKLACPQAKVYISARDSRLMIGDRSLEQGEPNMPIRGGVPKKLQIKPDVLLKDGDRVGNLLAIATPGHTPGSMSFLNERTGTIIAGDAMQTRGGVAVAGKTKLLFPFPSFGTWSKELSIVSAKKIKEIAPKLLAVGHGDVLENPLPLINKAIKDAEI
jgi:glyoxylase-like metal-dependent hydrolase (beta-lactamase superfamily II)